MGAGLQMVYIGSRLLVLAGPSPPRDLPQRMQIPVGLGVRVLHRDPAAELEVLGDRLAKRSVFRKIALIHRLEIHRDEPLPLLLGDLKAAMDVDQVLEA